MPPKRSRSDLALRLYTAVNDTDVRTVESLLQQGADPNLVLAEGMAAVHLAAGKESEKGLRCLKLILQYGADPNLRSSEDLTPLHISASWGCYQNLKLLLKNGGNPSLKDQDGNKPADLAEQEENSKCASILQEYESQAPQVEYEDLPKFQYSIYSGHSMRDSSIGLSSMLSDFGDDPLSSTRQSSFFRMSGVNGQPCRVRGAHESWLSDVSGFHLRESGMFDRTGDCGDVPPVLSSTRLSVIDFKRSPEGAPLYKTKDCSPDLKRSSLFLQPSRKSVSFRDSNEYFPAPRSPFQSPSGKQNDDYSDMTVDFSQYPDFLDSERMATVLQNQGIDVTSPDEVFVFCRGGSLLEDDFDKTIVGPGLLVEPDDDDDDDDDDIDDNVFANNVNELEGKAHASVFSSSGSSKYSSCDSDPYKSAIEGPLPTADKFSPLGKEPDRNPAPTESSTQSIGLAKSSDTSETENLDSVEDRGTKPPMEDKHQEHNSILEVVDRLGETPSPFVTGRTRSRLSRCSQKSFNFSPSVLSTSSLFEQTLPTPIRMRRNTPKSPYGSDEAPSKPSFEVNGLRDIDSGVRNLRVSSSQGSVDHPSQADTLIVSGSMADTLILPRDDDSGVRDLQGLSSQGSGDRPSQADTLIVSGSMADTVIIPRGVAEERLEGGGGGLGGSSKGTSVVFDEEKEFLTSDASTSTEGTGRPRYAVMQMQTSRKATCASKDEKCGTDSQDEPSPSSPSQASLESGSSSSFDWPKPQKTRGSLESSCKGASPSIEEFLTSDLSTSSEGTGRLKGSTMQMQTSHENSKSLRKNKGAVDSQEESSPSQTTLESGSSSSLDCSEPQRNRGEGSSSGCTPRYSMSRLYSHCKPQTLANLSYTPGGRPMITDMDEPVEYLYTDTEEGHELIETHVPPTSNTSLSSSVLTSTSEDTVLYDWRSLQNTAGSPEKGKENQRPSAEDAPETQGLTDRELRRKLVDLGERPGPITSHTRPLYIQKLRSLQNTAATQQPAQDGSSAFTVYSPELNKVLCTFDLPDCKADEFALCEQFDQPDQNKRWREGIIKSSFNYLLLDPRVTKNLPYRSQSMTPQERFQTFIGAIFYVGKGKRSRPYSHLYEALEYFRGDKTSKKLCSKVQHILQVWNCGQGVISLHCFQNVIPVEAYTREACMVDAIGLKMLTNQKRGDYYGVVSTWTAKRKRELGVHLLYRAMQIFLAEGERQLRPADIRLGQ
ncbi:ankyrin repeat and LEM domain-containing protein 1 [Colossoma macropomum]|uniref:ankyrin repeat and LEM domain-containing protein 1 n=1 Tax=Colossoma macropomum TaxID=42526 RepID=UPI001863FFA2|nr:ankyrin repeat and LEM domain-containing protein 1 [Colossoma macropomum]